jgi:hypothetical protein
VTVVRLVVVQLQHTWLQHTLQQLHIN